SHRLGLQPLVLHCPRKLFNWKRIEYVARNKPGSSRLEDAEADLLHVRRVMRIGVDDNLDAPLFRHSQVAIAKIEAVRISIELHGNFVPSCRLQNCVHVVRISVAAKQKTASRMSDKRDVRILDRL